VELGQQSDGINRNGQLEHEQAQEAMGHDDEQAQVAKASKVITPQEQSVYLIHMDTSRNVTEWQTSFL
jgi:hypothetical protein